MAPHLSNDEFFSSLSTLLSTVSQKSRGSVYLSQKRLSSSPSNSSSTEEGSSFVPGSILIRATDGKTSNPNPKSGGDSSKAKAAKVKISTIVAPNDLEAFYARYAEVCKAGMVGLKKRDRKKGKAKGKAQGGKVVKS
ncbi:hypothetical protein VTN77DRAFT_9803 [Rasamsonia byssochlamydoides]|uniref:uncharacterized protein n=1 Tax=Rasamsonia byssochlamydoides TaxID=89139 RepID=UPI003743C62B